MDASYQCLKDSWTLGLALGGVLALGIGYYRYRRWVGGGVCRCKTLLTGKTAIITGANTGIGLETAVDLARRGARVLLACRSVERGERAAVEVRKKSGNQDVSFVHLDLSSLDSVRAAAESILNKEARIDILVNNAGVSLLEYQETEDSFESHFGINHLGHFLLTNLLLPSMKTCPDARIVTVSSSLYKRSNDFYFTEVNSSDPTRFSNRSPGLAYSQSKLANILFTRSLSKRLEGTGVSTYAVHPGFILRTELSRYFYKSSWLYQKILLKIVGFVLLKSPWQGAQTTIYCAVADELEGVSGHFYGDCREEELPTAVARNDEVAEKLWRLSAGMVGLENLV